MAVAYYSTEVTAQNAEAHTPSKPSVLGGRKRYAYGTYETPTAGLADGSTVAMLRLPAGARVTSLKVWFDDMGNSSEAADIGVAGVDGSGYYDLAKTSADDIEYFEADFAVSSAVAGTELIAAITDLGKEFDKEVYVTATVETDAWAGDSTVTFECEYVVD